MSSFFSRAFKEAIETCPTETWSEHEDVEESSIFGKVKFAESQLIPDGEIGFQRNTDEEEAFDSMFSDVELDDGTGLLGESKILREVEASNPATQMKYDERKDRKEIKQRREKEAEDKKNQYRANTGSKPIYKSSDDAKKDNKDKDLHKAFNKKARATGEEDLDDGQDKITGAHKDARVRREMDSRKDAGKKVTSGDYANAYSTSRRHARRHNESSMFDGVSFSEGSMLSNKASYRNPLRDTYMK